MKRVGEALVLLTTMIAFASELDLVLYAESLKEPVYLSSLGYCHHDTAHMIYILAYNIMVLYQ